MAKEDLVADLSENTVEISSTFSGAEILLFGAYDGKEDDDIIVIVSGPKGNVKVQKKVKKFGVWVNAKHLVFSNVPKYYYVASNREINSIVDKKEMTEQGLSLNFIKVGFKQKNNSSENWREALTRNMVNQNFWKVDENSILLSKNTLFRKTLSLPSNVTTGLFNVKILHYRNGYLLSKEESKIQISKGGIGASIYNIAQEFSALYGIFAVILAVFIGWFGNFIFRKI